MTDAQLLIRLTEAVGNYFADEPQCVSAAAILTGLGDEFSLELKPRPVSMYAAPARGGLGSVATGDKAGAFGERLSLTPPVPSTYRWHSDFDRAGHMVVTADVDNWRLDATFSQFSYAGLPRTIITTQVEDVHPRLGFTSLADDEMNIRYWFEDEITDWRPNYDIYRAENRHLIGRIAAMVRDGRI